MLNIFLSIGMILIAWFIQNVIHEASHLLVGKIVEGRKPLKLIPFPHRYEGRFYFARYLSGPATKIGSAKHRHIAPLFAGVFMVFVGVCLTVSFGFLFIPFIISPAIDCFVWYWGYFKNSLGTDGYRYKQLVR